MSIIAIRLSIRGTPPARRMPTRSVVRPGRQIHAWYTSLFAETVRKMKDIDEGGSTLLDNTMLLYTSYMADGGHGTSDYPAMLVAQCAGNTPKPDGRSISTKARRWPISTSRCCSG